MTRRHIVFLLALVAVATFVAAVIFYQRHTLQAATLQAAEQAGAMVRPHSPVIGSVGAPVTIVEFFDPACEACKAVYPRVKQILAAFPRETRLVIRYTPFHREASVEAVRILEAARSQGRFESVLEALLVGQRAWTGQGAKATDRAWALAQSAGLDVKQAREHIASGAVDILLAQDVLDLKAIGVRATPTFFVNGKPLSSTDPEQLFEQVESEVERVRKSP
ncbi:MAG: disulfide bond formation protein DsbA [Betaproteobacteria bacterium HGW-Betaproteobacteria-16]|jgi:protein-disulfide isomerase|nr:MAG: disulfide bond formation protein DsbA [Betaproteobacteria bacterium HGW-Betaproteobacteria-16]